MEHYYNYQEGLEKAFQFMDGPYSIKLNYIVETGIVELTPKGLDSIWKIPMDQLIEVVVFAAYKVSKEFKKRNIEEKEALEKCVNLIRNQQKHQNKKME